MNEKVKINEAKYFFNKISEHMKDREIFIYNLSAFLSSSRSVLQYSLKEANTKAGGQQWYDNHILNSPLLKYFKDKRDINIHIEPVEPITEYKVSIKDTIHISDSITATVIDKNGNIIKQFSCGEPEPIHKEPEEPTSIEISYRFEDLNKNVIELCQEYLQQLETLINDGIKKGYISG